MSFAFIDFRPLELINGRTGILIGILSILAYMTSPLCARSHTTKDRLAAWSAVGIFVWWFFFQFQLVSLRAHVHYYLSPQGVFAWTMNSGICFAFGFGLALHLLRSPSRSYRIFGICSAVAYGALVLLLVLSPGVVRPVVQQT